MSVEAATGETAIAQNLERFLAVLAVSLSVATLSQVVSWLRQVPYTLLLTVAGLGLAVLDVQLVSLSPELILEIFLPPLLFEAAWNIRWRNLRRNLVPVLLFAVAGTLVSVVGIGWALSAFTAFSLPVALLVGASLAAVDPVAVIALFRELGAGERLTVLMEGESLFNDGVAVVAFSLLVGIPLGTETFDWTVTATRFLTFAGLGVGIGCLVGFGIAYLTQRFDLPSVEQALTLVAAYGTYLLAEEAGGSGVLGVVVVGLILGNFGSRIGMNPRTRLLVSEFWEFLAFFVNSIVFLLIGDQIDIASLGDSLDFILVAIAATLIARAAAIHGLGSLSDALAGTQLGWRVQTVLWWGGLRGSVSIALALSVPVALEARQSIIETVFGVVLFTLLVQGLSERWVLQGLGMTGDRATQQVYAQAVARRVALQRALDYLSQAEESPEIELASYQPERETVRAKLQDVEAEIERLQQASPGLRSLDRERLRERLLDIEADTYAEFLQAGRLDCNPQPLLRDLLDEST